MVRETAYLHFVVSKWSLVSALKRAKSPFFQIDENVKTVFSKVEKHHHNMYTESKP